VTDRQTNRHRASTYAGIARAGRKSEDG